MFSPRLLTIRSFPNPVQAKSSLAAPYMTSCLAFVIDKFHSSIPFIGECGGHSGRATPVPIPNTEDKPAHVPDCTEVREPSGTQDRCHAHPISL